jgi:hypothetical protein
VFRARSLLYCFGHCKKSCAATSVEKGQQETCVRVKIKGWLDKLTAFSFPTGDGESLVAFPLMTV